MHASAEQQDESKQGQAYGPTMKHLTPDLRHFRPRLPLLLPHQRHVHLMSSVVSTSDVSTYDYNVDGLFRSLYLWLSFPPDLLTP